MKSGNQVECALIDLEEFEYYEGSLRFPKPQTNFAFLFRSFEFSICKYFLGFIIILIEDYTIFIA